jgi:flagellar basal body rod protein FlgG
MQVGLYQSAASMDAVSKQLDVLAYNLANVSTPGFKRRVSSQESFTRALSGARGAHAQPRVRTAIDHSQGSLSPTGNPLDLAIEGRGFFKVETPRGARYLRSATFNPTPDGDLVTLAGEKLVVTGGIGLVKGTLAVGGGGEITQDGVATGAQIRLVDFDNLDALRPDSGARFSADPSLEKPANGEIRSGCLEQSNGSTVEALVGLVALSRAFESSSRAMKTLGETLQRTTTVP